MLTIVHEIKKNITNGVIKKDAFKVIQYVEIALNLSELINLETPYKFLISV